MGRSDMWARMALRTAAHGRPKMGVPGGGAPWLSAGVLGGRRSPLARGLDRRGRGALSDSPGIAFPINAIETRGARVPYCLPTLHPLRSHLSAPLRRRARARERRSPLRTFFRPVFPTPAAPSPGASRPQWAGRSLRTAPAASSRSVGRAESPEARRSGTGEVEGIEGGGARARHQGHCPTCVVHSKCFRSFPSRCVRSPRRGSWTLRPAPAPRANSAPDDHLDLMPPPILPQLLSSTVFRFLSPPSPARQRGHLKDAIFAHVQSRLIDSTKVCRSGRARPERGRPR